MVADQTHVLTFGLGDETAVTTVEIKYPNGKSQTINNPKIDRLLVVAALAKEIEPAPAPTETSATTSDAPAPPDAK